MDFKEKKETFERLNKKIHKDLKPLYDRMVDTSNKKIEEAHPISYSEYVPPCGITRRNENLSEEDIKDAEDQIDTAISSIMDSSQDYPELKNQIPNRDRADAGDGEGDNMQRVRMIPLEFPKWLEDIDSNLRGYFIRKKSRKGLDYEELVKGRIAKPKEKIIKKESALYVFMDTSGSMWFNTDKNGVPLIKVFASFMPEIAKEYNGELWLSDSASYTDTRPIKQRFELSDFRANNVTDAQESSNQKALDIKGGGGTSFWGIWRVFDAKVREMKETYPDAKVQLLFFSDMDAEFREHPELIHGKDVTFVTDEVPPEGHGLLDYINGDNIKLITMK